jgi:hypothetical protein
MLDLDHQLCLPDAQPTAARTMDDAEYLGMRQGMLQNRL